MDKDRIFVSVCVWHEFPLFYSNISKAKMSRNQPTQNNDAAVCLFLLIDFEFPLRPHNWIVLKQATNLGEKCDQPTLWIHLAPRSTRPFLAEDLETSWEDLESQRPSSCKSSSVRIEGKAAKRFLCNITRDPETNSKFAPENRPKRPKRKVVFQSSIFRGYVSFRGCMIYPPEV